MAQLGDLEGAVSLAQEAAALPEPVLEGLPAQDVLMLALLMKAEPWLVRWQKAAALKAKGNDAYRSSSTPFPILIFGICICEEDRRWWSATNTGTDCSGTNCGIDCSETNCGADCSGGTHNRFFPN